MRKRSFLSTLFAVGFAITSAQSAEVLVEAESFEKPGGWKLDTQFIDIMGSPYLLAHGLGQPVDDASTEVDFPEAGTYHVWVRTKNWIEKFADKVDASHAPGRFQLAVGGKALDHEFGKSGADWHWEKGGTVEVKAGKTQLSLKDLTGFNGRCDAILFTTNADFQPDNSSETLPAWRRKMLGLPEAPIEEGPYDIVFRRRWLLRNLRCYLSRSNGIEGRPHSKPRRPRWKRIVGSSRLGERATPLPVSIQWATSFVSLEDDAKLSPGTYEEFEDDEKGKHRPQRA